MTSTSPINSFAVGLNKGFLVTKIKKTPRAVDRKAKTSERVRGIRSLISSVVGLTSFEKRIFEMYKTGVSKVGKRAFRMLKRRLGTRRRALKKQDQIDIALKKMAKKN